jgi:tetratricopeptide (TPR) repeat protein
VARCLQSLADVANLTGDCTAAIARYRQARAIWEKTQGADHPDIAGALTGEGECLTTLGKPQEALGVLERALKIHTLHPGEPGDLATAQFALAKTLAGVGQQGRASPLAREALANFTKAGEGKRDRRAEVEAWLKQRTAATP